MIDLWMPISCPRVEPVLDKIACRPVSLEDDLRGRRLLFTLRVDDCGMDVSTLSLLRFLRSHPTALEGCIGSVIVDGSSELYTKQLAQEFVLAANLSGCLFPGKPVVEGTGSLYNQHILAAQRGLSWQETYHARIRELADRLEIFQPPTFSRPRLLVLHTSDPGRSSTLWLWEELKKRLSFCDIQVVSLQNGTIHDCRGCSYHACLHHASKNSCFYGGAISETVLPAIRKCNAMLFLCPNYNDAVSANITALFNRLTSYLLHSHLYDKYLFGMVISGYSGSDLVARQLLGAMCLNKTSMLPPRFCMLQTGNDLESVQHIPNLEKQLDDYAAQMQKTLWAPSSQT